MNINLSSHGIVALVKKGNKFLLLEDCRKLMKSFWAPPHGRFNPLDRTEKDIVIREVFEETGLKIMPVKKLYTTKADTKVKTVSFWLVKTKSRKITIDPKETGNFGWFDLEEILKLKLYPGTKRFFAKVKNGEIILNS